MMIIILCFVVFALSLSDAAQSWNVQSFASSLQGTTVSSSTTATLLKFCDSFFFQCFLPQLGKKSLLVNVSVNSLRKFLVSWSQEMGSSASLTLLGKGTAEDLNLLLLPIFCCRKLFYSESWLSTIFRLVQLYPEEYEAVSTFFPSSLMNISWPTDPEFPPSPPPSPSMEEHSGSSKATAVPAHNPMSVLWEKFSWCVCSGSWLCL